MVFLLRALLTFSAYTPNAAMLGVVVWVRWMRPQNFVRSRVLLTNVFRLYSSVL